MSVSVASVLLALQLAGGVAAPDTVPGAYEDTSTRRLVEQARERRNAVEGRIERYTTLSRSRVSIGLRALRRDRTFYRCEAASRIEWNRTDTIRVELLGAREIAPMFTREVRAGDGDCGGSSFDPAADRLGLALGGGMSVADSSFLRHPLAPGSEADYRFRSGGTTAMRLADGTTIRLLELQVLPRRSEPFLVSGSLWLEDRSHAVVRAVLRMARPFDYDRDFSRRPDADDDDDELPGFLRPLRADLRFVTIEYGLWDQQWWLPRLIAFEGEAEVGRLLRVPLTMERSYAEYDIVALPPGAPLPPPEAMSADSVCKGIEGDEHDHEVRVEVGSEGADVEHRDRRSCQCTDDRCRIIVVSAAVDSTELVHSEYLPPSIFDEGDSFMTDREMDELLERVEGIRRPPWQLAPVTWRAGLSGLDLMRYNRIEGLSVAATGNLDLGRALVEGTVRVGVADLAPNFELAASRGSAVSRQRVGVYRRLDAVGPAPRSLGLGSSLTALLFGRDDGDYYRSWGAELVREPAGGSDGLSWRAFAELQRGAEKKTDFSLPNAFGDAAFRPNIVAHEADQAGLEVRLRGSRGRDPTGWRGAATVAMLASAGSYTFVQPMLTLAGAAPLPGGFMGGLEVNGGTTFADAPLQSWYFLGGGSTVRGYGGNAAHGEAFWTARAEVATSGPGARIVLFSDAGWAGETDAVSADPTLLSVGAGLSILDGLLRLDVAHPLRSVPGGDDWRLELQVDAGL
jgi:hypothetical protein